MISSLMRRRGYSLIDKFIPEYILGYMNTTMLIKTDKVLKTKAQKLAKEMGLPLGTLVNNYLKTFVIERQATFTAPKLNKKTLKSLEKAYKDIKAGKNLVGPFSSVKDMIKSLES